MKLSDELSIVIPTRNRAEYLELCLARLVPIAAEFGLNVRVFDNASIDDTPAVAKAWVARYEHLVYIRNESNLGADANFEKALKMPTSKFVWLLGDTYELTRHCIEHQLQLIASSGTKLDAVVYNVLGRVDSIESKEYQDADALLAELGWHMTCMSALVFSSRLLAQANFARYRGTNFLQTGIIFESIADRDFCVAWVDSPSVLGISIPGCVKSSWQDKTFEIWVDHWVAFILSLPPSYSLTAKLGCIKSHGTRSRIFSPRNLLRLRQTGIFTPSVLRSKRLGVALSMAAPKWLLWSIALTPRGLIERLRSFRSTLTNSDPVSAHTRSSVDAN
jgi:abequosyltransferase